jgi:membrane-bound ClpP family serine protease
MSPLVWVASLLLVGLAVMVLEVFVPSGGVLGFISVVAIVSAIGMAFAELGVAFGMAVMGVAFVAVPCVLAAASAGFPRRRWAGGCCRPRRRRSTWCRTPAAGSRSANSSAGPAAW